MPLLVVPLDAADVDLLTLGEYDLLRRRALVLFEDPNHPLLERLRSDGVDVSAFDDDPDARRDDWALVTAAGSPRVLELARAGAEVTAGAARPPDSLTAAHVAPVLRRATTALAGVVAIMARLRSDDGCPWDREQTHDSLKVHLLEEAYEVIDSIEHGHADAELEEELGDVLLQVAFHARLAEQDGRFDVAGVADALVAKLVYRHPHVFGDTAVSSAGEVVRNWEALKAAEKGEREGPFDGIPGSLPALLTAYKVQKRAAQLGFESDEDAARARLEGSVDEDLGEALFWLVALARARGIDPEGALRGATDRFKESYASG